MKTIYLIKAESNLGDISYKIGLTERNPKKRLKELQTGNSINLEIINTFESNYPHLLEKALHTYFNPTKIKGEWFSIEDDQIKSFLDICNKTESNLKVIHTENTYWQQKTSKRNQL